MSAVIASLARHGNAIALETPTARMSYHELMFAANDLAQLLRGHRAVALKLPNGIAWVASDLACIMAGAACVPLPPFFTPQQCEYAMRDAGVSLVITQEPAPGDTAMTLADETISLVEVRHPPARLLPRTAKITYTSGTTGTPKGVCLSQEAMERVAQSLLNAVGNTMSSRHVCLLPLAILLENIGGVYTALLAGATCILPQVAHEPDALAGAINRAKATSCILVPELLRMLIAAETKMPSLRFAAVGGARVAASLLQTAHKKNIPAYEGYGITENASVITLNTPQSHRHGTAGKPLSHVELAIKDGEIHVRHPLFLGYLGEEAPRPEWYATGDLGEFDAEGFLVIHGRRRNVFITSYGRNVSPEWPESLLSAHPEIMQAALFGEARPFNVAVIVTAFPGRIPEIIAQVNAGLPNYARIGRYVIATQPFLPQNGQLTGNGRLKREAIFQAYQTSIDALYESTKEHAV